jgi:anti-sigma factor RsiW
MDHEHDLGNERKGATESPPDKRSGDWTRHGVPMIEMTDELLVAYVDGELSAEMRATVQARVAQDPVAQGKVKDMQDTAALLRAAFGDSDPKDSDLRDSDLRDSDKDNVVPLKSGRRLRNFGNHPLLSGFAAAAAIVLVVGTGLFMRPFAADDRAEFMADVAAYHSVYAQETEHLAEVPASRKDHIEEWLGKRLDRKLSIPDLSAEGWAFEGGRLLAEDDQPIAQLLYTAPGRQPIAVCITHSDQAPSQPPSKTTEYDPGKGIRVAAWDAEGYLYIVVGYLDKPELKLLAEQVRRHFGIV